MRDAAWVPRRSRAKPFSQRRRWKNRLFKSNCKKTFSKVISSEVESVKDREAIPESVSMKCAVISEKISNTKCSKFHFSQKLKLNINFVQFFFVPLPNKLKGSFQLFVCWRVNLQSLCKSSGCFRKDKKTKQTRQQRHQKTTKASRKLRWNAKRVKGYALRLSTLNRAPSDIVPHCGKTHFS